MLPCSKLRMTMEPSGDFATSTSSLLAQLALLNKHTMTNRDELIQEFSSMTGASADKAKFFLEMSGWELKVCVSIRKNMLFSYQLVKQLRWPSISFTNLEKASVLDLLRDPLEQSRHLEVARVPCLQINHKHWEDRRLCLQAGPAARINLARRGPGKYYTRIQTMILEMLTLFSSGENSKFRTLNDLNRADSAEDSDDEHQNLYAGGEKS